MSIEDKLIATANDLFREHGVLNVSMRQIISEAGLSSNSVYRKVKNKEDILLIILTRQYTVMRQVQSEIFSSKLNSREKLVSLIVLPAYQSFTSKFNFTENYFMINRQLINHCSSNAQQKWHEINLVTFSDVTNFINSCIEKGELEDICASDMFLGVSTICSGAMALVSQGISVDSQSEYIKKNAALMNNFLSQYHWNEENISYSLDNILRLMRTLCDQRTRLAPFF
ncbi:TetR/AcrR family transcriptional regulator [Ferrimonas kyonanensis]|uniref:TetR/AcrR family transcriptional regulator n=1 Tax=Ferrimonas kyonanensis TaxID=364763 RepID=UPI0004861B4B|nr:TetR/AcrR family transcriptional regulator [Ferrimonas kyonanensis]